MGEEIFITTDPNFIWDGSYNGSQVMSGSYPYKMRVQTNNGFASEQFGHITIVR